MSSEAAPLELEISGETVGEAKWLALRELERLHPGLDRELVQFEVLSEGERGLLGVGTTPARVIARLDPAVLRVDDAPAPSDAPPVDEGPLGGFVREVLERIAAALGAECRVELREDASGVHATVTGRGVGLVIGRGGRTIDAVQYLVSVAARRRQAEDGKAVDVDAAGYRERRRVRLTAAARRAADRAVSRHEPVALEPMTSMERKLVHLALQDVEEVETHSEGEEPERYVIVAPTGS